MITQQRYTYPWSAVIWSSILLTTIPIVGALMVSVGYGVFVGFQTRGDSVAIDAAVQGLVAAGWYRALPKVLLALVAFQRGVRLAQHPGEATRAVIGAALLTAALELLLALTLFGTGADLAVSLLVDIGIISALGLLGARLRHQVTVRSA